MTHGSDMMGRKVNQREIMLSELIAILEGKLTSLDGPKNNSPRYHLGVNITGDLCKGEHKVLEYEGELDACYGDNIRAYVLNARSIFGKEEGKIETFSPISLRNRLYVLALKIELLDESQRPVKTYGKIPEEKVRLFE